jgi:hypothetical protein
MVCYQGIPEWELWWSTKPIDMFNGAPFCLNSFMSYSRFKEILKAIHYTDKEEPLFFINMINPFNDHYAMGYKPLWLNSIDKLMKNSWLDKFFPGFMTFS